METILHWFRLANQLQFDHEELNILLYRLIQLLEVAVSKVYKYKILQLLNRF